MTYVFVIPQEVDRSEVIPVRIVNRLRQGKTIYIVEGSSWLEVPAKLTKHLQTMRKIGNTVQVLAVQETVSLETSLDSLLYTHKILPKMTVKQVLDVLENTKKWVKASPEQCQVFLDAQNKLMKWRVDLAYKRAVTRRSKSDSEAKAAFNCLVKQGYLQSVSPPFPVGL